MKILVSGATGLVGSALVPVLRLAGHEVICLSRSAGDSATLTWDPSSGSLPSSLHLSEFGAIIHLAGESIAKKRLTREQKKLIQESRIKSTRLLAREFCKSSPPNGVFICASAVGYYGDRADTILDEAAVRGDGFLAELAEAWEEEANKQCRDAGIRCVNLRLGIVLALGGGALQKMLTPFRIGLGAPLGSGNQYMSWISLEDTVRAILFVLQTENIIGPVNIVAPHAETNYFFTKALGKVLHRPTLPPIPPLVLTLLIGELAREALLVSTRAYPLKLLKFGFSFKHQHLEDTLRMLLKPRQTS